ncbi:hypothetical protein BDV96DRAFT_280526 [Lophiotrema nucula]|uniref:F-box domain-containing protein n=1 Tax=Lophiotrema nucula TaxID=690887 RepID=A0A6A5ZRJ9_9PLEO|nr:hypothetical protein BDV96DRAFT_280526 [Lophiotrema nucula]
MPINWDRDESNYKTPSAANRPVESPKSLKDVMDQLNAISLEDSDTQTRKETRTVDVGMAKLHAVLNKSKLSGKVYLKTAELRADDARQSIVKAWEIVKQAREAAAHAENNKKQDVNIFPFLALPTELRLLIYQELLVSDNRLLLARRGPRKVAKEAQRGLHTSIMRTCKKCADEGAIVLYGNNLFDFEEIRHRPFFSRTVSSLIGPKNASLIRFVIAEYPASYEELSRGPGEGSEERPKHWDEKPRYHALSLEYMTEFFQNFSVDLDQLRLLAISIVPFGHDDASMKVLRAQAPGLGDSQEAKEMWVQSKNEVLLDLIDGICAREERMKRTNFANIMTKLPFEWTPSFDGRHWIEYERRDPIERKGKGRAESLHTVPSTVFDDEKEDTDTVQESLPVELFWSYGGLVKGSET